jgi:hypothetical protein
MVRMGGLMLTGDQNVVDIGFQVVWNIADPEKYLFNLADPRTPSARWRKGDARHHRKRRNCRRS